LLIFKNILSSEQRFFVKSTKTFSIGNSKNIFLFFGLPIRRLITGDKTQVQKRGLFLGYRQLKI